MIIDPWIISFSAVTVIATLWLGFWSARRSKTAHDFFVAGRSVSVGWNASAISGEYLSAASFMGVAGMVMSSGYDALWYPVCYACGYLFLLLFIAGPLRRFGAYTIPDFAEGRFDSPVFRKIAVVFVLFIGFFYTMPQMKGAGTTLAYIFPGLPYWAGVVLVGAVITLNVALGGMKGITLVQAFQYWLKLFAISVPVFVLMAVYGHYGKQVGANKPAPPPANAAVAPARVVWSTNAAAIGEPAPGTFIANDVRQYVDAYLKSPMTRITEAGQDIKGKLATGRTPVNRDIAWTFEPERAPELLFKWCWIRAVSQQRPPDYLLYSSDLAKVLITPEPHGPVTNAAAADFLERQFAQNRLEFRRVGPQVLSVYSGAAAAHATSALDEFERMLGTRRPLPAKAPPDATWLDPFGPLTTKAAKAAAASGGASQLKAERAYALLYTYSLIIALVCGTAGLPHILVRFYTNPNGVAAKRTTMWVMILIGVFYVFPPVFGVLGRNRLPELYAGTGAKGTDKVVLELPRILNEVGRQGEREKGGEGSPAPLLPGSLSAAPAIGGSKIPWGSILSGITCAGAFAAFMSTFSGLLVSMTGALAHDVYGRMLRPKSTPQQRMRSFRVCAVIIGAVAIVLGLQVEPFQINFMVGQAFAIAAASYFPLLFVSCWWRGLTMKGAATGMLTGGLCALIGITLTSFSDLGWLKLADFWAARPLLRILCEQPAIWSVPLAIGLMVVVSKLTAAEVPADIRLKMLVLHAPEKLGLKQEYIQEHQAH